MSDPVVRDIGQRLRLARETAGLSQAQVAIMLGLHRPSISELEAGRRRVTADEIVKMARIYRVSTDWLLGGTESTDTTTATTELAARELSKLKPEDLRRLLDLLATLRDRGAPPP